MFDVRMTPLFLAVVVGAVFAVVTWGVLHLHDRPKPTVNDEGNDQMLLGLSLVAAFAVGAFLTYVFFAWIGQ